MNRSRLLSIYLADHRPAPFAWGSANCCHFAAGWVRVVCGRDPMADLPATPDARAAVRMVRQLGGLAAACSRQLRCVPMSPCMAQLGDLVLLTMPAHDNGATGGSVGICTGRQAALALASGGLIYVPLSDCSHAWRLPC